MKEIIKEHFGFKRQILKLAKSELISTYKGAVFGALWAIIKPSTHIFVYWFAFAIGLRAGNDVNGVSFFLFLVIGLIPWFFMKDAIVGGAACFRTKRTLITKMTFPISTIPTYTLLSHIYVHIFLLEITYVIVIASGVLPSIYNLQVIFYLPLMYVFFVSLSWITAPLSAISKDFYNLVKSLIMALFWLSGILWDANSLNDGILKEVLLSTPVTYFVNGYRETFLYKKWFWESPKQLVLIIIWLFVILLFGSWTYKKCRKIIPDVL